MMGPRDGARDASKSTASRDGPRPINSRPAPSRPRDGLKPPGPSHHHQGDSLRPPRSNPGPPTPRGDVATLRPPLGTPRPRRRRGGTRLPLALGPLTIHELGGPVVGGAGGTLPVGFRSTRVWGRRRYTCRVVAGPRCEILVQEEPEVVLVGPTPDVCHGRLLQAIGDGDGRPPGAGAGAGDEFFGLSHPVVHQLLHEDEEEEEDEEDEDEEDGATTTFSYGDIFLGSPTGSE